MSEHHLEPQRIGSVCMPLYFVFMLPYTALHVRQQAAGVGSVKHPVFQGGNICIFTADLA